MVTLSNLLQNNSQPTNLSLEPKKSILFLLYMITVSSFTKDMRKPKQEFIDKCAGEFEVNLLDCVAYLDMVGGLGVLKVLKSLPDLQKELLLQMILQYANYDGLPQEKELMTIGEYLKKIDLTEKVCLQAIFKTKAIESLLQTCK